MDNSDLQPPIQLHPPVTWALDLTVFRQEERSVAMGLAPLARDAAFRAGVESGDL